MSKKKVYRNEKNQLHSPNDDTPAIIRADGTKCWYRNGIRHREGGPAAITPEGREIWYQNDHVHRLDGPAIIGESAVSKWWVKGVPYYTTLGFKAAAELSHEDMVALVLKYGQIDDNGGTNR